MKMKVDLSKFKLKHKEDKSATLVHPDGHEFKVAIHALHPLNRKNLDTLKMADGGEVADKKKPLKIEKIPSNKLEIEKLDAPIPKNPVEAEPIKMMASGGESDDSEGDDSSGDDSGALQFDPEKLNQSQSSIANLRAMTPPPISPMAEGGQIRQSNPKLAESKKQPRMYAEGDEVSADDSAPANPVEYEAIQPGEPDAAPQQGQVVPPSQPTQEPSQSMPQAAPQQPSQGIAQQPQAPQSQTAQSLEAPTAMGAYQQELQGVKGQAKAQTDIANKQYQYMTDAQGEIAAKKQLMDKYQKAQEEIMTENQNLYHDVLNGHIDPNHYLGSMTTGQKITTGIAMMLGGMGAGVVGGTNPAVDFLNKQIEQDIDAQKTQLGKKQTLLSANLKMFNNLGDAINNTRIQMYGLADLNNQKLAAQYGGPIAASRAQSLSGELQAKYMGPAFQQLMMSKLSQPGTQEPGQLDQRDPAEVAGLMRRSGLIDDKQHEAIGKEIERAQDTRNQETNIMKSFEDAVKSTKGFGRATSMVKEPREVQALQQNLMPTVKDLEGTVRMAAMDSLKHNLSPNQYDNEHDTNIRREALKNYLQAKKSAPMAKGMGIDLDKFASSHVGMPDAPVTKTYNGVQYVKVHGGWRKAK